MLEQTPNAGTFTCLSGAGCGYAGLGAQTVYPRVPRPVFAPMPKASFGAAIGPRPLAPARTVWARTDDGRGPADLVGRRTKYGSQLGNMDGVSVSTSVLVVAGLAVAAWYYWLR